MEIAARTNGNSHPEFHNACMGANQADLVAMAAVRPGAFVEEFSGKVYRKQAEAMVHNTTTELAGEVGEVDQDAVAAISSLETVFRVSVKLSAGERIRPTTDLSTSPLRIFMTGSPEALQRDCRRIQEIKDQVFLLS